MCGARQAPLASLGCWWIGFSSCRVIGGNYGLWEAAFGIEGGV